LKPANVKITPQGKVKVLDFGLAKAVWGRGDDSNLSCGATLPGVETMAGQIVGTPGYMSPEQANGGPVDERTDVWAFGCLLYELLTGKRAFGGEAFSKTVAVVVECEPDCRVLPAKTPTKIRQLLRQCLQNDVSSRLANIADARRIIGEAQRGRSRWRAVAIAAGVLAIAAMGAVLFPRTPARPSDQSQCRFGDPAGAFT
jgi:serine/threonine protein kinase